jgi:hypothetical protein
MANANPDGTMGFNFNLQPANIDLRVFGVVLAVDPAMTMTREPKKLKCPNCMSEHAYCPAPALSTGSRMRLQDRYSHNARAVFFSGSCPICLEDPIEPPMVAFACGHLICVDDFKKLGGRVGADAMKTAVQVLKEEREETTRMRTPSANGVVDDDDDASTSSVPALLSREGERYADDSDNDIDPDVDVDVDNDDGTSSDDGSMPGLTPVVVPAVA